MWNHHYLSVLLILSPCCTHRCVTNTCQIQPLSLCLCCLSVSALLGQQSVFRLGPTREECSTAGQGRAFGGQGTRDVHSTPRCLFSPLQPSIGCVISPPHGGLSLGPSPLSGDRGDPSYLGWLITPGPPEQRSSLSSKRLTLRLPLHENLLVFPSSS